MSSLTQGASILAERAGKKNDVSFIKEMKDMIVITSARFKADSLAKKPSFDKYYLQRFNLPLKPVDAGDECNTDIAECDMVYRSIAKVPQPLRYTVHPFNYVGAPDGSHGYGWTTFGTEPKKKHKKLTAKFPRHTYVDDYIYVFNKKIDVVGVIAVFSDPREVAKFKCMGEDGVEGKPCYSDEQEFPIDEPLMQLVIKEITSTFLRLVPNNEEILIKEDKNV